MITFKDADDMVNWFTKFMNNRGQSGYITTYLLVRQFANSLVTPPRPFERGDRVEREGSPYDILRYDVDGYTEMISADGEFIYRGRFVLTLITPTSDREIKVGDTFSCSGRLIHGDEEFTAKQIGDHSVTDTNGHAHALKFCTFRSRPQPTPQAFADDPAIQVAINAGKHAKALTLLSEIGELIEKWDKSHDNQ